MPQKTRSQKERATARREAGQMRTRVAPAPIEAEAPESDSGLMINVPSAPKRRVGNATVVARPTEAELDYNYVYSDLRRIALLAILCFGIMIALAFILNQ